MAYCIKCGKELVENAKFCQKCGNPTGARTASDIHKQEFVLKSDTADAKSEYEARENKKTMKFCMDCGQEMPEGAKFCLNCGTPAGEVRVGTENRKITYDGELHKCPNCGELLKSFVTNCPSCGYELRGVKTNSPVETLAMKVEKASDLDEKIELITNFYIPNTKEDIYDFFILAVSNLEDKWYDTDDAWRAKLEQAYHKAKISFGNTAEFEYLEELYTRTRREINKRERSFATIFRRNKRICITGLLIGVGILLMIIGFIWGSLSSADNIGTIFCVVLGMNVLVSPAWVLGMVKEKPNKRKTKDTVKKSNSTIRSIGKDHTEFYQRNYEDMAEFLRSRGFKYIVVKPERKGLLDTEGSIKGISVAGNAEFDEDDEFDINSKIIIRYYSRKG